MSGYDVSYVPQNVSVNNESLLYDSTEELKEDTTPAVAKAIRDIVLPIICACGILGILLTIIVLSRKNMSTSTNCYLMGLACADLFFLILFSTRLCQSLFKKQESTTYYLYMVYATYAAIFTSIFLLMSIWVTVMLAIERYIAICRPFLAAKMCSVGRARLIIVGIFLLCVICRMPVFFQHKVVTIQPVNHSKIVYLMDTELVENRHYISIYPWVIDVAVMSVIPFLLLLILNVCLIWEVHKSTAYIQQNLMVSRGPNGAHAVHREEVQITIMLISVIIVFFICQAPYVIYMAIGSINRFQNSYGSQVFRYVAMLLLTFKSAVNFIIYCWFSEKFWTTLKQVFCIEQCVHIFSGKHSGEQQNGSYFNLKRFSSSGNTRVTFLADQE